jgi:hypothetical protein
MKTIGFAGGAAHNNSLIARFVIVVLVVALSVAAARAAVAQVEYVIAISVDGLRPDVNALRSNARRPAGTLKK